MRRHFLVIGIRSRILVIWPKKEPRSSSAAFEQSGPDDVARIRLAVEDRTNPTVAASTSLGTRRRPLESG
jgi:hypothetical protein